jgi:DNA-binding GntR family transcriptional regulator
LRDGLPDLGAHATEEDEQFHRALAEATGSAVLMRTLAMIESQIHFVRQSDITNVERLRRTCDDHLEILNAVRRKDLKTAVAALIRNIEWAQSNVEAAFKDAVLRRGRS